MFQSEKLETVGNLAGCVAHEFNSILTAIIGQSELLLCDLPVGSPLKENAKEINKAAGRAANLTRQLLAYGRKQLLQPKAIDLNRVLSSMEVIFHNLLGDEVKMQIVPASGLQLVKADAGQIEQVIMNLAVNAREAMPQGGKLTLETLDFDLLETVESTFDILAARAQANGTELVMDLPPVVPRLLRGDPGRLRQVLVNLVGNAIKFTTGGEVVVRVAEELPAAGRGAESVVAQGPSPWPPAGGVVAG